MSQVDFGNGNSGFGDLGGERNEGGGVVGKRREAGGGGEE